MSDNEDNIISYDCESNSGKLLRLFPYIKDKTLAAKLKTDMNALYYITPRDFSQKITDIIINLLENINLNSSKAIITDATACVGGNAISFAKHFKFVHSIEINETRIEYLKNNINIYDIKNMSIIHGNCLEEINKITDHDVVFIDPPWGGKNYKDTNKLRLNISDISIENIAKKLMDTNFMNKIPKLILFKLPINYDIEYFHDSFADKKIYYYNLEKMLILAIIT